MVKNSANTVATCSQKALFTVFALLSELESLRPTVRALEKAHADGQLEFFGELAPLSDPACFAAYLAPLKNRKWVVYAKAPLSGPRQILEYLGRYTHRVAMANSRLRKLEDGQVTFDWKDYRDGPNK